MGRDLQSRTRRQAPLLLLRVREHEGLDWIGFYNDERLHEALGDIPPSECESDYYRLNIKRDNTPMLSAT